MKPRKNVVGEIYGRLIIIDDAESHTKDRRVWVKCDCGKEKVVLLNSLRRGETTSCGCYNQEVITKHGQSTSRIYKIYKGMINRCSNPNMSGYHNYGGKGVAVCKEWLDSFEAFYSWAMQEGYSDSLTIERKNPDGNYEPSNCTWVTEYLQQRNRRKKSGTSSKYIGVSRCKQTNKWLSIIKIHGKAKNLGRYSTEVEAAMARDKYIVENHLEGFSLNFRK